MDEIKIHEEEIKIEEYFEEKKVYQLMKNLMKKVVTERPEDPIDFLIDQLEKPKPRRVFLVGPPGSNRKEIALSLGEHF